MGTDGLKWKVRLIVIGVFLLGGVCGGIGVKIYDTRSHGPRSAIERLKRDLNLSAEQVTAIEKVLETSGTEMQKLYDSFRPQVEASRMSTRQQIRALLTPEQQKKYDQITQEWDRRREQDRRGSQQRK